MSEVERTPRQVIEQKLLTALDDESKVAVLLSQRDLSMLVNMLVALWRMHGLTDEEYEFLGDLKKLQDVFESRETP